MRYTRRQTLRSMGGALCGPYILTGQSRSGAGPRIESIEPKGPLVRESTMEGHRLRDNVAPAHPNGAPLSKNRWMILYSTRSFRGIDDDLSMIYQLRRDAPDGPVIREGFFKRTQNGWDAAGDGRACCSMQHSHPVIFGVPRGARIQGKPAPHANVFAAWWRRTAVYLDKESNRIAHLGMGAKEYPYVRDNPAFRTQSLQFQLVEWLQFRLNAKEDDIEIIQPVTTMRQKGYESGEDFCSGPFRSMNASFVQPVAFNRDCTEWVGAHHFGSQIACCRYTYEAKLGRYEWTQTGPVIRNADTGLMEASVVRFRDSWILGIRLSGAVGTAWTRTDDLFGKAPDLTITKDPATNTPRTAYACADGVLRLFTGDPSLSSYHNARDPLFCWDVDPDKGFAISNRRVVFDIIKGGLPMRREAQPWADNCKLLPPQGRRQYLLYRVLLAANDQPRQTTSEQWRTIPAVNQQEKAACGCYYSVITYSQDVPPMWHFG